MKKMVAIFALAIAVLVAVPLAQAQKPGKVYRIGYLSARSAEEEQKLLPAFLKGLNEMGYAEGKNIIIERRMASGKSDRLYALAEELVHLNVGIIVSSGGEASYVARKATKTIPIVFTVNADPVGTGLVATLARPGGNITGLSNAQADLVAMRLELLKEAIPSASRVAVLWNPDTPIHPPQWNEIQNVAPALGVTLLSLEVRSPEDFNRAITTMKKERPDGLVVLGHGSIAKFRRRIIEFSLQRQLPGIYSNEEWVITGGLMSYGANFVQLWQRAATIVDKILKGGKRPAEIPVEQPTKFDLVINLKTAKKLGIRIPPEVLFRATKVIK